MTFTLVIDCDNAAFDDGHRGMEVGRLLHIAATRVNDGEPFGVLYDVLGNQVGCFAFEQQEAAQ